MKRLFFKREVFYFLVSIIFLSGVVVSNGCVKKKTKEESTFVANPNIPKVGACQIYPDDNSWNLNISKFPVHSNSDIYIANLAQNWQLHPNFVYYFDLVGAGQPPVTITYSTSYGFKCDQGPMPIPADAQIQGGAASVLDRHVVVLDQQACVLYELFKSYKDAVGSGWTAGCGAIFDLKSNAIHTVGLPSSTASGLPLYPSLIKYDEVVSGGIFHAMHIPAFLTQKATIPPAYGYASNLANPLDPHYSPMGLRIRLKANFDISAYSPQTRVILQALKDYGGFIADNNDFGGFLAGVSDSRWDFGTLVPELHSIPVTAFEAVYTGEIVY